MPNKGYKKPPPIIPSSLSPTKTRSGHVRSVRWSPQIELHNAISKASVNLDTMPVKRSPIVRDPVLWKGVTPSNAFNPDLSFDSDATPQHLTRSILRQRILELTPMEETQTENFDEERERSALHVETQDQENI